ncbi:MAG: hypothetical protein ACI92G_002854, partial [Candidatus Pelagisphaera sp.]
AEINYDCPEKTSVGNFFGRVFMMVMMTHVVASMI